MNDNLFRYIAVGIIAVLLFAVVAAIISGS